MESLSSLREGITELFGEYAYSPEGLNRKFLSAEVFSDPEKLQALNNLVHPVVRKDFRHWSEQQTSPYVIQEAAILFETGGNRSLDYTILVIAPQSDKEQRVMLRDSVSLDEVKARMRNQWSDGKKVPLADFVIENKTLSEARKQVVQIHKELLKRMDVNP
jgi:dephospho-CoA kinase